MQQGNGAGTRILNMKDENILFERASVFEMYVLNSETGGSANCILVAKTSKLLFSFHLTVSRAHLSYL